MDKNRLSLMADIEWLRNPFLADSDFQMSLESRSSGLRLAPPLNFSFISDFTFFQKTFFQKTFFQFQRVNNPKG